MILRDLADERLFDSYEQERCRHVRDIMYGAVFLGRIMHTRSRAIAFLRNWILFRPLACFPPLKRLFYQTANRKRPLSRGFIGSNCPRLAGQLAIQPPVQVDDHVIPLDDVLGNRFCLLSRAGCLDLAPKFIESLGQNMPFKHVEFGNRDFGAIIGDDEGLLAGWFDSHQVDVALIRPDRYIFDAGKAEALGDVIRGFKQQIATRRGDAWKVKQSKSI